MNTSQAVKIFKYIQEQPEIIKVISWTFQQIFMFLPLLRGDRRLLSSCKKGCNGDGDRKVLNLFLFKCIDIFSVTAPTVFIPSVKASLRHTPALLSNTHNRKEVEECANSWKRSKGREYVYYEREGGEREGGGGERWETERWGGVGERRRKGEREGESVNSKCVRSNKLLECSNSFWTCRCYSF